MGFRAIDTHFLSLFTNFPSSMDVYDAQGNKIQNDSDPVAPKIRKKK